MESSIRPTLPIARYRFVYVFASEKEFRGYRDGADGFYQNGPERDYIVMHAGADAARVALHEHVHLVLNHSAAPLPKWFEEGTAASPFYTERQRAGMLNLAPAWRDGMPQFVLLLAGGRTPEEAFQNAFGRTLDQAVSGLGAYLREMRSVSIPLESAPESKEQASAEPVSVVRASARGSVRSAIWFAHSLALGVR